jgi:glycosyltransferase involved in cell wall biosynthesis
MPPLVSCIMPTRDRRRFVEQSIWYFLRQDYPRKELVVVDDGDDRVEDLIPSDDRIRYVALPARQTIGAKRNIACELARGELVAHWDDDDWMSPERLSSQVAALDESGADVCGADEVLHYRVETGDAWIRGAPNGHPWLSGGTLVYRRSTWNEARFPDVGVGEDRAFVERVPPGRVHALRDPAFYVGVIHKTNAAGTTPSGSHWRPATFDEVERRLASDRRFYLELRNGFSTRPRASVCSSVTVVGNFIVWDGYGSMAEYLALGMARAGAAVSVVTLGIDPMGLTSELAGLIDGRVADEGPAVWFAAPPGSHERLARASDVFVNTMWESDRLPPQWLEPLSRARAVVVPTRFVADVCRREGVTVPIEVIPEGVDPEVYAYVERPARAGLTTLVVGPIVRRKHTLEAVAAWKRAFANDHEARLILKAKFGLRNYAPDDRRIRVIDETEPGRGIAHWYREADVLLALGNEGFGLPLVEAMATGLPVVALASEGQRDTCEDAGDLVLAVPPRRWEPCDDTSWGVVGVRGVPAVADVARRLRWVAEHRDEARDLGRTASRWALANRNVWEKGPAVLEVMETRMAKPRPLRRTRCLWAPSVSPQVRAFARDLADATRCTLDGHEAPDARRVRLLHVQHDVDTVEGDVLRAALEARLAGARVVVTDHAVGSAFRAWERETDVFVAVSSEAAAVLRGRWPAKRVATIPPPCPEWAPAGRRRPRWVVGVVAAGGAGTRAVTRELARRIPDAKFVVLEPSSLPAELAQRLRARADVAVFVESDDAARACMPFALAGALASGLPVVAPAQPAFADVADATYQTADVATGIKRVLARPALRDDLVAHAAAYCRAHSISHVAERHLALWKALETT